MKSKLFLLFVTVVLGWPAFPVHAALSVSVSTPNGGEVLESGIVKRISWANSPEIDKVTVFIVDEYGTQDIIANGIAKADIMIGR